MDPFYFGQSNPLHETDPETDPGSKKNSQNNEIFPQKSTKINKNIHFPFSKVLNLCLTDINISPVNNKTDNFLEKYISYRKK